jgi:hypothetical protein
VEIRLTDEGEILIRGGENISAKEIEELLLTMAGVAEVAVLAARTNGSASTRPPCSGCAPATRRRT